VGDVLIDAEKTGRATSGRATSARTPLVHLVAAGAARDGGGHIGRMLALGEALRDRRTALSFSIVGGRLGGEAARRATRLGLREGPSPSGAIVVVDLPRAAEAIDLAPADRLVVFDDGNAFGGEAAIVLQPSLPTWTGPGRGGRVLAGYAYAPLARRYRDIRDQGPAAAPGGAHEANDPPLVLICFGGSDPALVTERLAPSLAGIREDGPGWRVVAIVGAGHPGLTEISGIEILRDPADLPEQLAAADLAIVGGGMMKFEAACLRRPAILVAVADDQVAVGPPFASTGAALWLGDGRSLDPAVLREAVGELIREPWRRSAMAVRAGEVVDGRGADRLADAILGLSADLP
jgi:spore coat polysaccharide biosynthesis predicted glycosyltransferase SpsG